MADAQPIPDETTRLRGQRVVFKRPSIEETKSAYDKLKKYVDSPEGKFIPAALVSMNAGAWALVVEKASQQLLLYRATSKGTVLDSVYKAVTGKNLGSKQVQGDHRTPEGVYFFTEVYEDKVLAPKYGDRALVMDYPNPYDNLVGKNGSGIWLHADDNENRFDLNFDSRGCVVVSNEDIWRISRKVRLRETPIIIYERIPFVLQDDIGSAKSSLEERFTAWLAAWQSREIDPYMAFYDKGTFNSRKMNWNQWRSYKKRLNKNYECSRVQSEEVNIFEYEKGFVTVFKQTYESPGMKDVGYKWLYWLKGEDGQFRIFRERFVDYSEQINYAKVASRVPERDFTPRKVATDSDTEVSTQ
jgi:murein L,D-transpeptidase YafK